MDKASSACQRRKTLFESYSLDRQMHGHPSGGQDEFVIRKSLFLPGFHIDDGDGLVVPVDGLRQGPIQDFDSFDVLEKNSVPDHPRGRIGELFPFRHIPAYEVGHTATGIGEQFPPFDNGDFRIRVQARKRAAVFGPAATPPIITTFIFFFSTFSPLLRSRWTSLPSSNQGRFSRFFTFSPW